MRITPWTILFLSHLAASGLAGQSTQAAPGGLSETERVYGLALLWREASYNFAYFDRAPGLDWSRAFQEYLPQVEGAATTLDYYRVLQRFLAQLHDGHTKVLLPDSIVGRHPFDAPRILIREVEHRAIVANVDSALEREIPLGSEIVSVDGTPVADRLEADVFPWMAVSSEHILWRDGIRGNTGQGWGLLVGPAGTKVRLALRTPDGRGREVSVPRDRQSVAPRWLRQVPKRPLLEYRPLEDSLAYLALNSFNDPALLSQFDSVLPGLRAARGLVIDVRSNGGGMDQVVLGILDRLFADTLLGPAWRTRIQNATYRAWGRFASDEEWARQYAPYYQGEVWKEMPPDTFVPTARQRIGAPVTVLIGMETESSAENFLIYLHGNPRVTLVGQPTVGSSGQPLFLDLPGGGRAWICTKRNTYPDGRSYIGTGILPDVLVPVTVEDVREGRDRTLERAVAVLQARLRG